jgi:hypothetical protein
MAMCRAEPLWKGRLRVIEKGSDIPTKCFVRLEDADTGQSPIAWFVVLGDWN